MSGSYFRQRPTMREMLTASLAVTPPDTLDLYGILADGGNELLSAAADVLRARQYGEQPTDNVMACAEAAAMKVALALSSFQGRPQ